MAEQHQARLGFSPNLLTLMGAIAIVGSNSLLLSPILADVARGLRTTPVAVSYAICLYSAATAFAALLLGPRIDRIGARRALLFGLACLIMSMLLSAGATHWLMLGAAQCLAGVGAGLVLPSTYGLALTIAPEALQSRAVGRVLTGWSVSLVAGVPIAALISQTAGWRFSFLALAALACLAFAGAFSLPDNWARPERRQKATGLFAPLGYAGVPALLTICVAYMAAFYGIYAFVGDYVRALHGIPAGQAGLIVLAYGVGFGAGSLADGLVDRVGPRRLFPPALFCLAAIYALMAPATRDVYAITALAGAWGFANHFGLGILVILLGQTRPDERGAILGLNSAVTYLASMAGVAVAGVLYSGIGFRPMCYSAAAIIASAGALAWWHAGARELA